MHYHRDGFRLALNTQYSWRKGYSGGIILLFFNLSSKTVYNNPPLPQVAQHR